MKLFAKRPAGRLGASPVTHFPEPIGDLLPADRLGAAANNHLAA